MPKMANSRLIQFLSLCRGSGVVRMTYGLVGSHAADVVGHLERADARSLAE